MMLHSMYYDIENGNGELAGTTADASNNTPFSVKDILNLVDQNDGYLGCQMDG